MSHVGNWSEEKHRRVASEMAWDARCRRVGHLHAWGLEVWVHCQAPECKAEERLDLSALVENGQAYQDLASLKPRISCRCGSFIPPRLLVQWDKDHKLHSPPPGWRPPIPFDRLAEPCIAAAPIEHVVRTKTLTIAMADQNEWEVSVRCDSCESSRNLSATSRVPLNRNLIDALEKGRITCRQRRCHSRPASSIVVGRRLQANGYHRLLTIRLGARIEVHEDGPWYPERGKLWIEG
jgi:hypothetical protein